MDGPRLVRPENRQNLTLSLSGCAQLATTSKDVGSVAVTYEDAVDCERNEDLTTVVRVETEILT